MGSTYWQKPGISPREGLGCPGEQLPTSEAKLTWGIGGEEAGGGGLHLLCPRIWLLPTEELIWGSNRTPTNTNLA